MSEEMKAFIEFSKKWGAIIIALLFICFIISALSSCSGSKHLIKSSSSIDSAVNQYSKLKLDSTVTQSKQTTTEINTNKGVYSQDDYQETTITEYKPNPETKQPEITKVTTHRTGKLQTHDTTKTTKKEQSNDSIAATIHKDEKKVTQSELKKAESNKSLDSHFGISIKQLALVGIALLAMIIFIYVLYRKGKAKAKEALKDTVTKII